MQGEISNPASTYHISLLLDESFDLVVRKVSSEIHKKFDTEFVVDGKEYLPHLTLYLFAAPIKNEKKIISKLKDIMKSYRPQPLNVRGLIVSWDGWLMIEFGKRSKLNNLHRSVVRNINPLRENTLRKKYNDGSKILIIPNKERNSLKKYGDRHAMQLFHPHVSLTKFEFIKDAYKCLPVYDGYFKNRTLEIAAIELVKDVEDGSGGLGKSLFKYNFK